jgi:hypothetical protein
VPGRQAGAGTHLTFETGRKLHDQPGPDSTDLSWPEFEVRLCRPYVVARRLGRCPVRKRQVRVEGEPEKSNLESGRHGRTSFTAWLNKNESRRPAVLRPASGS